MPRRESIPTSTNEDDSQSHEVDDGSDDEEMGNRPPFPATTEQGLIGAYQLDDDDSTVVIPANINRFLREYQREGVQFMYNKFKQGAGGVLGDDMG